MDALIGLSVLVEFARQANGSYAAISGNLVSYNDRGVLVLANGKMRFIQWSEIITLLEN